MVREEIDAHGFHDVKIAGWRLFSTHAIRAFEGAGVLG